MTKLIVLMGFMGMTLSAFAQHSIEFPVFDLKATEFVDTWALTTEKSKVRVELDCTSFINGLNFYHAPTPDQKELLKGIFLHHHECQNLGERIYQLTSRSQALCLTIDPRPPNFQISKDWKNCRSDLSHD